MSIFAEVMGSDFGRLHPMMQRRFGVGLASGEACVGRGVMASIRRGPWWTVPFLQIGRLRNILVPDVGENVPFVEVAKAAEICGQIYRCCAAAIALAPPALASLPPLANSVDDLLADIHLLSNDDVVRDWTRQSAAGLSVELTGYAKAIQDTIPTVQPLLKALADDPGCATLRDGLIVLLGRAADYRGSHGSGGRQGSRAELRRPQPRSRPLHDGRGSRND